MQDNFAEMVRAVCKSILVNAPVGMREWDKSRIVAMSERFDGRKDFAVWPEFVRDSVVQPNDKISVTLDVGLEYIGPRETETDVFDEFRVKCGLNWSSSVAISAERAAERVALISEVIACAKRIEADFAVHRAFSFSETKAERNARNYVTRLEEFAKQMAQGMRLGSERRFDFEPALVEKSIEFKMGKKCFRVHCGPVGETGICVERVQ